MPSVVITGDTALDRIVTIASKTPRTNSITTRSATKTKVKSSEGPLLLESDPPPVPPAFFVSFPSAVTAAAAGLPA